ncbi:MAG: sugar ABC transporter ATP-binding protein [Lachnospiraceae bacterium]|nr:sugar ABC transporter ATP-binding protein [Lachnospiraceae bacterium]
MAVTTKIEMQDICVEFPGVKALQDVNFSFESGHVTALVGANGAGKSTLMKVLSGVYNHYTGQIYLDGKPVEIRNPNQAKDFGFETVYQEVDTALVSTLTVAENIMMDYLARGLGHKQLVDNKYMRAEAKKVLDEIGVEIPLNMIVEQLSMAQKQMVLIARAVLRNCKFLILDEPTAPLSNAETEKLFNIVRGLRDKGVGVIFISHRLNELFEICETMTVLRDGRITEANVKLDENISIKNIVEMMLGRAFDEKLDRSGRVIGENALEARGLTEKTGLVKDINMYVRKGEIVGISGLVGAGKTELCKTIYGAYGRFDGELLIDGKPVNFKNPQQAVKAGIALIPEERRKEGIIVGETVATNMSMATLSKYTGFLSIVNTAKELESVKRLIEAVRVKTPSPKQRIENLSGGNQQKITIGKWLDSDAEVYIFDEPTKGIDVGAKQDVYKLIVELARQGKAIIYSSSEQSEILQLTDRVYIMYGGKIQKEFNTDDVTEEKLLLYSTGGKENE